MRSSLSATALLAALALPLAAQEHAEDADHPAAGGGAVPAGWTVRADGGDASGANIQTMGKGLHVTTGPAVILYRADTDGKGPFHTLATFTQTKPSKHAEGYGLFVGGTNCSEARIVAESLLGAEGGHTFTDFGDDAYTSGRAHPMIDPTIRLEHLERLAADETTGVFLLDVVLGHGAEPDPAALLGPAIAQVPQPAESARSTAAHAATAAFEQVPSGSQQLVQKSMCAHRLPLVM